MPRASFAHGPRRPQQFYKPTVDTNPPVFFGDAAITLQVQALDASGAEAFTGAATEAFQKPGLAVVGAETFVGTAAEAFQKPGMAAVGAETFTGAATIAFQAPILSSSPPIVLALDEPHRHPYRHVQPSPPKPIEIPFHVQIEPTVVPYEYPVAPVAAVAIDPRAVIMALFASGIIDETEFAAMLAA